jgi:hypothetical protein
MPRVRADLASAAGRVDLCVSRSPAKRSVKDGEANGRAQMTCYGRNRPLLLSSADAREMFRAHRARLNYGPIGVFAGVNT